jgi:hypothetical protein
MKSDTETLIRELLAFDKAPCLSLYMPTHRSHPDNLQDVTRYKSLVKQLEASLSLKYSTREQRELLEPFEALSKDSEFWNHTSDGLAVFSAPDYWETVYLQVPVKELAMVADSFHTKPLRKYLQSGDQYHVLCLSQHDIKLYEGNRHSLTEIILPEHVPATITAALGEELTEKHTTVASYGGTGGESSSMHHGHGGKKEELDSDAERFFRLVANNIGENYSKPTGWPLILAALTEHHHLFQQVNKNPLLLPKGITVNPAAISVEKLATQAWEIMQPEYEMKLDKLAEQFMQAKANGKGSDDMKEVAQAAVEGRVDTLLVEADRIIAVRITNLVTGNTQNKDLNNPRVDDLLDDMGELVLQMGGKVMVIPPEKMPSETGLAAIFRY